MASGDEAASQDAATSEDQATSKEEFVSQDMASFTLVTSVSQLVSDTQEKAAFHGDAVSV